MAGQSYQVAWSFGGAGGMHDFGIVEAERQCKRLVEVVLRLWFDRADGEVEAADAFQEGAAG